MEEKQPPYNEQPPPYEPGTGAQAYPPPGQAYPPPGTQPYPPMGYHPTMTQPTMVTQTIILPMEMGGESRRLTCPHCHADVNTTVIYKDGRMTHLAALLLCLFVCWPCCFIPYCVDSCKDADHECPNCHRHLGTYRR